MKRYPLDKSYRNLLEKTVKEAREVAETAAKTVLEQLGVDKARAPDHLSDLEHELRIKLRTHGRQLGDHRQGTSGTQKLDRLTEETAYQHWHRMLFARYLAENNLLMYPDPLNPVAVTLEECEEMAKDEGAANGWELASRFASQMLPRIFHVDSPVFRLSFPPENQQTLTQLVSGLPKEAFTAQDSLGWVYQFWQTQRKKDINESEVKIGAAELPAVTQLFTEPYMVSFLLDNSLGAWWASRTLSATDLKEIKTEDELRKKAALPGVPLDYLRFVKAEDNTWTPAAGIFESWPEQLKDLKTLDPCCGSGHFLIAALTMLAPMRMKLEGLTVEDAVDAVLRDNIHGLELDERCVEIAAFNLAFTAWTFPGAEGYRQLPELQVACCGLSVGSSKEDWLKLAEGNRNLSLVLGLMHDYFKNAPILGSLLNPAKFKAFGNFVQWEELETAIEKALKLEDTPEWHETSIAAQGIMKTAQLLGRQYNWVITNPPFLTRGKQDEIQRSFSGNYYSRAKNDLATVFLDRCLEFCVKDGTASIVLPQNWLFLTTYRLFREQKLKIETMRFIVRLGSGAFETISGEVVKAILIIVSRNSSAADSIDLIPEKPKTQFIRGLDVSGISTPAEKANGIMKNEITSVAQYSQLNNPDARLIMENDGQQAILSEFAICPTGIVSGDGFRWYRQYWEIKNRNNKWIFIKRTTEKPLFYSGLDRIVDWSNFGNEMISHSRDNLAYNKTGINVNLIGDLSSTIYKGWFYDQTTASIVPKDNKNILALFCYCCSKKYAENVRKIDQKFNITPATLIKVPFDLDYWTKVAAEKYPNGLPKPFSDDPTQWIFHGHPCGSVIWDEQTKKTACGPLRYDETILHIAVARLLGYSWPAEHDAGMELSEEQREWVNRCDNLLKYADNDGIVCLPPLRGERSAAERLLGLLMAAYGENWEPKTLQRLLKSVGYEGKTLDDWLKEKFFTGHCKLFQNRPFIWHIWDGLRDGFSVLVNYHKLDHKLLETLIYTYLGDWISRQQQDKGKIDGAEGRLAAAEALKKKLELILEGEKGYDIFVRWKPLDKQPIGWAPDLNDGVRINIRPFMRVGDVRERAAGVLRAKPNISWDKDRGKDADSAPWYKLGLQYGGKEGDRINDHHLSLEEKRKARENYVKG